jgi:hypothetical protein
VHLVGFYSILSLIMHGTMNVKEVWRCFPTKYFVNFIIPEDTKTSCNLRQTSRLRRWCMLARKHIVDTNLYEVQGCGSPVIFSIRSEQTCEVCQTVVTPYRLKIMYGNRSWKTTQILLRQHFVEFILTASRSYETLF